MNARKKTSRNAGAALLVVLIIVMAITITALGFMSQSDVELACGRNMVLRTQMDYLAESGLEHARGLVLNPQDVSADYWTGGTGLQLVSGSGDRYDVTVNRDPTDRCNYIVGCDAYREKGTERIGLSRLHAILRLDPCIAYWVGSSVTVWPQMTIEGDVYCEGTLTNNGSINGDAFAVGTIIGAGITGRRNESVTPGYPVVWPGLVTASVGPTYYIGSTLYAAEPNLPTAPSYPSVGNPAGIRYCVGDVNMPGGVTINGTLVVGGNLAVSGANTITAVKNLPALLVGGQVLMKDGSSLTVNGLTQVEQQIAIDPNATNATIDVTGGLFVRNGGVTSSTIIVNVTAAPAIASIEIWPVADTPKRWGPAVDAFFKSIERIP